jgi:hypothetical protein
MQIFEDDLESDNYWFVTIKKHCEHFFNESNNKEF